MKHSAMKTGRGKLLKFGRVSVRITCAGQSTQVCFSGRPQYLALAFPNAKNPKWHAYVNQETWVKKDLVVHLASKEELDAIGAEVKRVKEDPAEAVRAAKSRQSSKNSNMKKRFKVLSNKIKACLKELIRAGAETSELEQRLALVAKEALVEAIQEA